MVKGGCTNADCGEWPYAVPNKLVLPLPDNEGWFMMVKTSPEYTFITTIYFCPWCGSPLTPPEVRNEAE